MVDNDLLDQTIVPSPFFVNGEAYTQEDFLSASDEILASVAREQDFSIIADTVRSLTALHRASGIALAKLVFMGHSLWIGLNKGTTQQYFQFMAERSTVRQLTLERYHDAWNAVQSAPDEAKELLLVQPMKNLQQLGSMIEQGFEVGDEQDWMELADTTRETAFRRLLHEKTGKSTNKNFKFLMMDEMGNVFLYTALNTEPKFVFSLDLETDDDDLKKMHNRIINRLDIIEQGKS